MLRERQRELIERAKTSSKIAASPMGVKPDAPRLDPLGSPKGPVTPLALEEASDYFANADTTRESAALGTDVSSEDSISEASKVKGKISSKDSLMR